MIKSFLMFFVSLLVVAISSSCIKSADWRTSIVPHIRWWFFVTGKYCLDQRGQNDFDHATNNRPSLFIIITGPEPSDFWFAEVSHKNV